MSEGVKIAAGAAVLCSWLGVWAFSFDAGERSGFDAGFAAASARTARLEMEMEALGFERFGVPWELYGCVLNGNHPAECR